jgi:hypothetical protein
MEAVSSVDAISIVASPTTFATLFITHSASMSTIYPESSSRTAHSDIDWSSAWSACDATPTNAYSYPTSTSESSSSSSDNSSSHSDGPIIGIAAVLAFIVLFVIFVEWRKRKITKREYLVVLEHEPNLTWKDFKERREKRIKEEEEWEEAQKAAERAANREAARRRINEWRVAKLEAKLAKLKGKRKETDGDMLLDSMGGKDNGRRDLVDSHPPPYSSVIDPEGEVGMKPW